MIPPSFAEGLLGVLLGLVVVVMALAFELR